MLLNINDSRVKLYGTDIKAPPFRRLPEDLTAPIRPGLDLMAKNTSGLRLRFATDSRQIKLNIHYGEISPYYHMSLSGAASFDLFEEFKVQDEAEIPAWKVDCRSSENLCSRWLYNFRIPMESYRTNSAESIFRQKEPGMHHYTLYFPLYASVDALEIHLDDGSEICEHAYPYSNEGFPYVFYGSSITHGGCANKASNSYPALLSRMKNIDIINLGFSGNAKGDIEVANYIANMKMRAFFMDYDENAPDVEWLEKTHESFFKIIREAQPKLPIIILPSGQPATSQSDYEYKMSRRKIIKQTFNNAVKKGDTNVYYLDMTQCFYGQFCHSFSVDNVHPNDAGFMRMAKVINTFMEDSKLW
jgi:hypothetical protein